MPGGRDRREEELGEEHFLKDMGHDMTHKMLKIVLILNKEPTIEQMPD